MSDDIRTILQRLAVVEGKITPVSVKSGLNKQQQGVPQLPALFKGKSASPVLGSKKDPKHPADGYMVGDSVEPTENPLEEAMRNVEEDVLSKVKKDLTTYLDMLANKAELDKDLVDKAKDAIEHENEVEEVAIDAGADVAPVVQDVAAEPAECAMAEDPTELEVGTDSVPTPTINPTLPESAPVKSYTMEDGSCLECWGNERDGFEIRHKGRSLPSRFRNINHADMAVKLFQKRRQKQDLSQDYIEER